MKNIKNIILIVLIVLLLIFVIWKMTSYQEKSFKPIKLTKTNYVINKTQMAFLDTVVHEGLNILDFDSITVILSPLSDISKNSFDSNLELKAYLKGNNRQYMIWIDNVNHSESISILSHELIHLKQYYLKQLVIVNDTPIWEGTKIPLDNIPYQDRPWEKNAVDMGLILDKTINYKLY